MKLTKKKLYHIIREELNEIGPFQGPQRGSTDREASRVEQKIYRILDKIESNHKASNELYDIEKNYDLNNVKNMQPYEMEDLLDRLYNIADKYNIRI